MLTSQLFVAALAAGTIYALVALGLNLIYGTMRLLNVAHGGFYSFGAYTAAWGIGIYFERGLPDAGSFFVLAAAAVAVGLTLGVLIERGVLLWMYDR